MTMRQPTWLIYNGASGSHDDAAIEALVEAMRAAGYDPDRVVDAKDGTPDTAAANSAGIGVLAVHGGDGTLSRTIGNLEGFSGQVLPLPGGTYNLLAREMFGDRDPLEIVGMLGSGQLAPLRRTCIRGDGIVALCELLAGPGAKWADVREELREANVGEVLAKGWDAAAESTVGPMVAVVQPAGGREGGYAGVRLTPRTDGMTVQGFAADGIGDYIQQGLAILKRDFREGPNDDLGRAATVRCRSLGGEAIPLMVDGERSEGANDLAFSLDTLEVDLLGIPNAR